MNFKGLKKLYSDYVTGGPEVNIPEYLNNYEDRVKMASRIKKLMTIFFIVTYSYLVYDKIYQWYTHSKEVTERIK